MATASKDYTVRVIGDASSVKRSFRDAETAADKFARRMNRIGGGMVSFGKSMTRNVTLPVVAALGASVKAAVDFDDSMTKSTAIMGDLSKSMRADLEKAAREVAVTTKFSATEAAESYFFLASAGLDAAKSIKALPVVAKFATAGNFDMALATDLLTDAQSALGLTVKDAAKNMANMARVGDVLVKANVLANATTEQFSESLTNKGAAALRLVNKPMEEGVALLAAWADQGVKGRIAGNYLNIMLRDLQTASLNNEDAWKKAGIAVYDTSGRMRNSADIIGDLEKATDKLTTKQKKQFFAELGFQDKSFGIIATLLGKSKAIARYEKELRKAGGTTETVANKQMKSMKEQLRLLKDQFVDVGIDLGRALIPALKDVAEWFGKVATWFKNLDPAQRKAIVKWGLIAAAIGPVVTILGKFVQLGGWVVKSISGITKGLAAMRGAMIATETTGFFAGGKWTQVGTKFSRLGVLMRALPWAALTAGVVVASREVGKFVQSWSDKSAMKTMGMTADELDRFQKMSAARFGGKARQEFEEAGRGAKGMAGDTDAVTAALGRLQAKAATVNAGKPFRDVLKEYQTLEAIARDPIMVGRIDAAQTKNDMRSLRDDIMGQFNLTQKQADAVMKAMFGKKYKVARQAIPAPETVKAKTAIQNLVTAVQSGSESAIAKARAAFDKLPPKAKAAALSAANGALANMRKLESQGYSIGAVFATSVAQGILNGSISTAASSAALQAEQAMRRQLQMHSPSQVGVDIGSNFSRSVADGITASTASVATAATTAASAMATAMQKALGGFSGKKAKRLASAANKADQVGSVLGVGDSFMSLLSSMTEVDPKLFEVPANAFARLANIIRDAVKRAVASLRGIKIPKAVLATAEKVQVLSTTYQGVLDVMRGVSDVNAGQVTGSWSQLVGATGGMANASRGLPAAVAGGGNITVNIGTVHATSKKQANEIATYITRRVIRQLAAAKRKAR